MMQQRSNACRQGVPRVKRLIDESEIRDEVARLGRRLADDYRDRPLTVLGVLTGSIILLSDLIRQIDVRLRVGLIQASSYRGRVTRPGELAVGTDLIPDIAGRDVVLIDDIFDTGRTLSALVEAVQARGPRSVRSAVLLWKEGRSEVDVIPDYHCFKIPNVFVVGYGLDYNDEYRHLPYIAALDDEDL
jgi:hypoxanthine phosphoribosyltransferase